jgi:CRISPR/Cas system-associated protein Cas10 (large subunit of type III CRISPR-Cas system)
MQCPTHIKKLEKITESGDFECEVCGRPAVLECKSCQFKQCSECRICNERHNMIKIIDLNVPLDHYKESEERVLQQCLCVQQLFEEQEC